MGNVDDRFIKWKNADFQVLFHTHASIIIHAYEHMRKLGCVEGAGHTGYILYDSI